MKLRLWNGSLCVRVGEDEMQQLLKTHQLTEVIDFAAGQRLTCRLKVADTVTATAASCSAGEILVLLPRDEAQRWAQSDQVTIEAAQPVTATQHLQILIEKDLHRRPRAGS